MQHKTLRGDVFGGITAAVIALPLALAFGVASGLGPMAGLYSAIAVGFFASLFGGTPAQVSGPTGPMTVVMAAVVAQYADSLATAFAIVFLGGAIQFLLGVIRVGRYIAYTPYSVISGFMSGIGIIIIVLQLLPLLGADGAGGPVAALRLLPDAMANINVQALVVGFVALAIMVLWPPALNRLFPAPLAALIAGTLLALFWFGTVPVIGEVPTGLPTLTLPVVALDDLARILQPALVLALLGCIDSLLTSLVTDSITRTRHDPSRELMGQGIGNMAAGLVGALPGAGATMRTVVNVRAGGHSRRSGMLHSLILLSLVLGLAPLAERIPLAVLAGILLKVGWDIIDWGFLKRIGRVPRDKVAVMLITLSLTVFVDLITAVAVGLIVAALVTADWMSREELKGVHADHGRLAPDLVLRLAALEPRAFVIHLEGRYSYASARGLTRQIGMMSPGSEILILDLQAASRIDVTAAMAIDEVITGAEAQRVRILLAGATGDTRKTLDAVGVTEHLRKEEICDSVEEAIAVAERLLKAEDGR
ncbi:SulP family inorganic anion transporter [Thioalkalicoccus limnaeus]|uniref:SulP family inorganic anion transporter n=1 Tax=Thioalkalicoccus limnaeus TaxID=120681 RepID=A0ABV4BCV3_9GAMM